jgi:hypothetical protein
MAALTSEDQDKINALQIRVRQALSHWDSSDQEAPDFNRLAPEVDNLVRALQSILEQHAGNRKATLYRAGGRVLLALAVAIAVLFLLAFGPTWWLLLPAGVLLAGIYLLAWRHP